MRPTNERTVVSVKFYVLYKA